MDLLAKLKAGRDVVKTFKLGDVTLGLRILTERDHQEAGWAANKLLDEYKTELKVSNADLFESEKATQLIQRFVIDPATKTPVFATAEIVLDTLSRDERNAIGDAYYEFEKEYSPSERTLTDAAFAALLEDVKKKPDMPSLNDLSGALLKRLVISLAARQTK
ncbi:MAG: hypothetical protein Q8Q81_00445 [Oxalobacteraceae bacterium]|nr:hypothetical protein [Oxalobacteraceae bacterium]